MNEKEKFCISQGYEGIRNSGSYCYTINNAILDQVEINKIKGEYYIIGK